jgi:membrane-associated PAP2 superfamily phosphatase
LWRGNWFAKNFMHAYLKWLIVFGGLALLCVVLADAIAPWQRINQMLRHRLRFVALASILIPTVISLFKHFSILHCPSEINRYGGQAQYLRLLDQLPDGMQAGHCFPAGHASAGLWLAAACVFYLPNHPKKALTLFYAGLGLGFFMGWVQQMRGEHFLSHTLWSAWLASLIIVLMLALTPQLLLSKKRILNETI